MSVPVSVPASRPLTLSIVVPTYNERDRLTDLVDAVLGAYRAANVEGELIIVDDNSPDGTGALADSLAATRDRLRVIHRTGKLGLGTAVVAGFEAAGSPIVGVVDADLSHPPALLPKMLAIMTERNADIILGSRYIAGGGSRNWPVGRLVLSRFACVLARPLTPVVDATSGLFLIRRDIACGVRISAGGFKICLELLVRGRPATVIEVPYVFEGRTAGESKMNLKEATGYLRQLRDLWRFKREQPPLTQRYQRVSLAQLESLERRD